MDEQRAKLQGLWRKAYREEFPVKIPCKTASAATKLRFAMYESVRAFRRGTAQPDEELGLAIQNCQLSFDEADRSILVICRKTATELMAEIDKVLGGDPTLIVGQEEIEAQGMMERLTKKIATGEVIETMPQRGIPNAYNTRE